MRYNSIKRYLVISQTTSDGKANYEQRVDRVSMPVTIHNGPTTADPVRRPLLSSFCERARSAQLLALFMNNFLQQTQVHSACFTSKLLSCVVFAWFTVKKDALQQYFWLRRLPRRAGWHVQLVVCGVFRVLLVLLFCWCGEVCWYVVCSALLPAVLGAAGLLVRCWFI